MEIVGGFTLHLHSFGAKWDTGKQWTVIPLIEFHIWNSISTTHCFLVHPSVKKKVSRAFLPVLFKVWNLITWPLFMKSCIAQRCGAEQGQQHALKTWVFLSYPLPSQLYTVPAEMKTVWGLLWTEPASNSSNRAGLSKVCCALLLSHAHTAGVAGAKEKAGKQLELDNF